MYIYFIIHWKISIITFNNNSLKESTSCPENKNNSRIFEVNVVLSRIIMQTKKLDLTYHLFMTEV